MQRAAKKIWCLGFSSIGARSFISSKLSSRSIASLKNSATGGINGVASLIGSKNYCSSNASKVSVSESGMDVCLVAGYPAWHTRLLAIGHAAPTFVADAVVDGEYKRISLSEYIGQYVVLLFYPSDFSHAEELIAFSDRYEEFKKLNVTVLAISTDSKFAHLQWTKLDRSEGGLDEFKVPLLSDVSHSISRSYGTLEEKAGIANRGLFVIDAEGFLRLVSVNNVPDGRSVAETLRLLKLMLSEKPDDQIREYETEVEAANSKVEVKCHVCNEIGHIGSNCPTSSVSTKKDVRSPTTSVLPKKELRSSPSPKNGTENARFAMQCSVCKKYGHEDSECWFNKENSGGRTIDRTSAPRRPMRETRAYDADRNEDRPLKCFNCGQEGHPASKCPEEKKECTKCGRLGHVASACRAPSQGRSIEARRSNVQYAQDQGRSIESKRSNVRYVQEQVPAENDDWFAADDMEMGDFDDDDDDDYEEPKKTSSVPRKSGIRRVVRARRS